MASRRFLLVALSLAMLAPALMGARGEGCGGAAFSMTPAPNVEGQWDVTYDDMIGIEITLGGAVYTEEIGATGGAFTIDHEGTPITFDLDCARPEVVCPSETWPATATLEQRNAEYPHRMFVQLPRQTCSEATVPAEPAECGDSTLNPDCADVCMGDIVTTTTEHFGVINEEGDHFDVLLGAGVATNGVNCALLGVSAAGADLVNVGTPMEEDWESTAMEGGVVTVAYAGGCLWAGDPDDDGTVEAIVIGAGVKFTTGFTAVKQM
jgi:hypothetical protein